MVVFSDRIGNESYMRIRRNKMKISIIYTWCIFSGDSGDSGDKESKLLFSFYKSVSPLEKFGQNEW